MSDGQPNAIVFFLDRTHGKLIRELLADVGLNVRTHRSMMWPGDKLDTEWIAECGGFHWVIISGDKQIERVPEERQAVINGKCKVFMFDDSHITHTADWAASFLVARHRIIEIITKADGPFFVTIKPCKVRGHVSMPRFVEKAGGGWRKPDQQLIQPPEIVTLPETPTRRDQQEVFEWARKPK